MSVKLCNQCKIEKPFNAFHKQKNGLHGLRGMCIECHKIKRKEQYSLNATKTHKDYYYENHEERKTYAREWHRANKKRLEAKTTPEERKAKRHEIYVRRAEQAKAARKAYYEKNIDRCREAAKKRREAAILTDEQRAARAQYRKSHYQANKEKSFEYTIRRSRTMRGQTPSWADIEAMRTIYKTCIDMNKEAGCIAYHVDHVIPLRGKEVSGLHVPDNLRIVPAIENLKKGTKHVYG